jgi:hypothetical protein
MGLTFKHYFSLIISSNRKLSVSMQTSICNGFRNEYYAVRKMKVDTEIISGTLNGRVLLTIIKRVKLRR